jgi:hypothetical protein
MSNEERFDEELRGFLDWQSGQLDGSPDAAEMAVRVSRRNARRSRTGPSAPLMLAIVALALLAAAIGATVVGSHQRPSLVVVPSSPGATPAVPTSSPTHDVLNFATSPGPSAPPGQPVPSARPGQPIPLPAAGTLDPGTYFLANPYLDGNPVRTCSRGCAAYRQIIFTLPAGWATSDGLVYKHLGQPGEVSFSAWTVDQVYADPCHWQGSTLSPLDLANHSHDATGIVLAPENGGLANQALRGPRPKVLAHVALGGVIALRIDLSVPAVIDISTCDLGEFRSWTEWDVVGGANSHSAPGQLDSVYMVDVDRRPLVIDAVHMPAASKEDLAELKAILGSMIIDRGP